MKDPIKDFSLCILIRCNNPVWQKAWTWPTWLVSPLGHTIVTYMYLQWSNCCLHSTIQFYIHTLMLWHSMTGLGRSILVVFKLFTLDGWYRFYKSFIEVHEVYSSSAFIFTWVFLSAFLLGNLFPALLITNFQRIRGEVILKLICKMFTMLSKYKSTWSAWYF